MQFLKICHLNTSPNSKPGKTVGAEWLDLPHHVSVGPQRVWRPSKPVILCRQLHCVFIQMTDVSVGWDGCRRQPRGIESFCVFPLETALFIRRVVCSALAPRLTGRLGCLPRSLDSSQLALAVGVLTELTCRAIILSGLSHWHHQEVFTVRTVRKYTSDYHR